MTSSDSLPMAKRPIEDVPGHWLLARLGKRVLRPGGKELTRFLIRNAGIPGGDVVELAPGLGKTAQLIVAEGPRTYVGVDEDASAVAYTQKRLAGGDSASNSAPKTNVKSVEAKSIEVKNAAASDTGCDGNSKDVVIGEAMLTMQGDKGKHAIVDEASRILRSGGRYAIHELCIEPDTLSDEDKTNIRKALARSIKVNARPLTTAEWSQLLEEHGFRVEKIEHAPMHLLKPRRNIQDEGLLRSLKILFNVVRQPGARRRVLAMRKVFNQYSDNLAAIAIIAVKD